MELFSWYLSRQSFYCWYTEISYLKVLISDVKVSGGALMGTTIPSAEGILLHLSSLFLFYLFSCLIPVASISSTTAKKRADNAQTSSTSEFRGNASHSSHSV